jgi:hypothetical protein
MFSENKLNISNNNIALKPIAEKPENELKLGSIRTDFKNESENKISISKQRKFITMDNYWGKDNLRIAQSKEKIDILRKDLKSSIDDNAKSHNLLTFFKSMNITKNENKVKLAKNYLFESKENNKNTIVNSVLNTNENASKSVSDDNKNKESKKREISLSTNKAFIYKFLLSKF